MSTRARAPVVLLVQRNDDAEMYAEFLTHEGVTPLVASNAVDAVDAALRSDIVITGIRLNGELTGLDLIARLRADERTRDLPIIVLTASAWRIERERALNAGCDLFLPKPCLPEDLLRHVHLLLAADHTRARRTSAKATADQPADRRTRGTAKPRA
jgi:two-component system cell cycle response regulator DivK